MPRKDILTTAENVIKILLNKKEHSINSISHKLKIQWKTAVRVLGFLKRLGLVKERSGKTTFKSERLFSLNK